MGGPDPGTRESEERNQNTSPVLLGKGNDGEVSGGIQEEGDKVSWLPCEGLLYCGNEEGVGGEDVHGVCKGTGKSRSYCRAGAREEVDQVSSG